MDVRFRNALLLNTEQHRHASLSHFANLKAYGDEGRLPSILFEPGTKGLLLEDTGRSSSSCILERRTDFTHCAGENEECIGWIGAHWRVLRDKDRE